jgi:Membrane-bound lytic murein transglycosylase
MTGTGLHAAARDNRSGALAGFAGVRDRAAAWLGVDAGSVGLAPVAHEALMTGYFEPELPASLVETPEFPVPIYAFPENASHPMPPRAAMRESGAFSGQELVWLADPVDAFFLQVQGSGRLRLPDGTTRRVGYAGGNGHPYVSIGKQLIEQEIFTEASITGDALADWLRARPDGGQSILDRNPSYVFFRFRDDLDPTDGPVGTLGVPLTPGVSVAVDPDVVPLSSVLWVTDPGSDGRLCRAQDTGSAIKGPGRLDLFCGTGDEAGLRAGRMKDRVSVWRVTAEGAG